MNTANFPVISTYTRTEALEDGILVDVPEELLKEAGIKVPVAVTAEVFGILDPTAKESDLGQSLAGRMWDIIWMASLAMRRADGARLAFQAMFMMASDRPGVTRRKSVTKSFVMTIGPDDLGDPVITIMLPGQD